MTNLERAMNLRERVKVLRQQVHGVTSRGLKHQVINASSYPDDTPYFNCHLGAQYMTLSIAIEKTERHQYERAQPKVINDRALANALAKVVEKNIGMLMTEAADLLEAEAADAARLAEKEYETMKNKIEILRNAYPEFPENA